MKRTIILFLTIFSLIFSSCTKTEEKDNISVGVFVPGIVSGSPVYEMLVSGVSSGIDEYNSSIQENQDLIPAVLTIMEAGTNQAEWSSKITALVATGNHDVIISSNPSLPDLIAPLTEQFPEQKFIILDAFYEGNENIKTVRYNQREQAYLSGFIAGLVTTSPKSVMRLANPEKKIALVAAQEYPVMNDVLLPAYIEGAKSVDADIEVEFRIVGNWYDASKASDIAKTLFNSDIDVILPICGGASQGIIAEAQNLGYYVAWFDDNGFSKAPGYIISSSVVRQNKLAREVTLEFLNGKTEYGVTRTVGISDGYVDFIQNDDNYINTVDQSIRHKLQQKIDDIKSGILLLPSP